MLRSRAGTELLIEGVVRIVDWASYKNAGEGQLSSGNFLYFVLCELTSAHAAEYPLFVVVRHRFSPFKCFRFPSPNTPGKSMVETEHGSTKTTEQTGPIQHCLTNFRSKQKSPCSLPFQDYYQRPIRGFTAVAQCLSLPKCFPGLKSKRNGPRISRNGPRISRINTNQKRFVIG